MAENGINIAACIEGSLQQYFTDLEGELPCGVYDMVLTQVEVPLLRYIMTMCDNNQTKAAQILGLNRNTLRKKLMQYNLLDK